MNKMNTDTSTSTMKNEIKNTGSVSETTMSVAKSSMEEERRGGFGADDESNHAETSDNKAENSSDALDDEEVPMTFPQRLMDVLSNERHDDVVTWLPHGKAFIIYKKKRFAAEVLPLYFKQSKFTSFTRKLNRWGFTRVTRGPETGSYYHKFFQRGDMDLCMQMTCQSSNRPAARQMDALTQNNNLIRHQLQQLQLQQLQLQQLQMQQQQQLQAAELLRQAMTQQQQQQQVVHQVPLQQPQTHSDDLLKQSIDSLFLQTLQKSTGKDASANPFMGGTPGATAISLLPSIPMGQPGVVMQPNVAMEMLPEQPPNSNGRAWAA